MPEKKVQAIGYDRYGDAGQLRIGEVSVGDPGPGEVVVRVAAAAINPIDWKIRDGQVRLIYRLKFPVTAGFDFCGKIVACGDGVEDFRPEDRVCGMSDRPAGGALAERLLCSAAVLARVPESMSDEEAAGLPLAGLTALQGLRVHGRFGSGMRVLIVGASGGVGHLAVQLASHWNGRVTAVCGSDNRDWVGELGPEKVLDYRKFDWFREAGKFNLIYDTVGALGFGRSRSHLESGGSYVTTLPGPGILFDQWLRAPLLRRRARTFLAKPVGADLAELIDLWKEGHLRIRVDRTYDWKNFRLAFTHSESGHAKGKIVLRITG